MAKAIVKRKSDHKSKPLKSNSKKTIGKLKRNNKPIKSKKSKKKISFNLNPSYDDDEENPEIESDIEDEEDLDETAHETLVNRISKTLSNKDDRRSKIDAIVAKRTEAAPAVDQFGMGAPIIKSTDHEDDDEEKSKPESKGGVNIQQLLNAIKDESVAGLKKQIRKVAHKEALAKPLETKEEQLARRKSFYDQASKEISKWDPVIEANQKAAQLVFPLNERELTMRMKPISESLKDSSNSFSTKLEMETNALLKTSENVLGDKQELTKAEEKFIKSMSIAEARERHKELQRMRALLSFQEAKFKRQKKVKSKTYRRIMKKERLRAEMKEFEDAARSDPSKALEKMEELERERAQERASLRHRNTSKWAQHQKIRAKYDKNAKEQMQEQLEISHKLMEKANAQLSSDEESNTEQTHMDADDITALDPETEIEPALPSLPADFNPWIAKQPVKLNLPSQQEELTKPTRSEKKKEKKLEEEREAKAKKIRQKTLETIMDGVDKKRSADSDSDEEFSVLYENIEKTYHGEFPPSDDEEENDDEVEMAETDDKTNASQKDQTAEDLNLEPQIDPTKIITLPSSQKGPKEKILRSEIPNMEITSGLLDGDEPSDDEDVADGNDNMKNLIREAFAGDEVISEFKAQKAEVNELETPKDVSNYLPGWGNWAGPGIKVDKRKKRKFTLQAKKLRRKDAHLEHVIIYESASALNLSAIQKHQVNQLPHRFRNVTEFEKSIATPIGRTWMPEVAHQALIAPAVVTKRGQIIDPIDEDALIRTTHAPEKTDDKNDKKSKRSKNANKGSKG